MSERIGALEVAQGRIDERVADLEEWRAKTNGHLGRIEARLNNIGWGIAATLGGVIVNLIFMMMGR